MYSAIPSNRVCMSLSQTSPCNLQERPSTTPSQISSESQDTAHGPASEDVTVQPSIETILSSGRRRAHGASRYTGVFNIDAIALDNIQPPRLLSPLLAADISFLFSSITTSSTPFDSSSSTMQSEELRSPSRKQFGLSSTIIPPSDTQFVLSLALHSPAIRLHPSRRSSHTGLGLSPENDRLTIPG